MSTAPGSERHGPPIGRVVLVVVGSIVVLASLLAVLVGGVLVWAHATQRDDDGFFTSPSGRLETTTYAITSDEIDLGARPGRGSRVVDLGDLATVRIEADPVIEKQVFVGIGPEDAVEAYLEGVAHAEVTDIEADPFAATYRYEPGAGAPDPPADQGFWASSVAGPGAQSLEWEPESGRWAVVVMNADGSAGVGVEAAVGVKSSWVLPVGVGLLAGGFVALVAGAVALTIGAVGLARELRRPSGARPVGAGPVRVEGRLDEPLNRWLWLLKWALALPHLIVLAVLWVALVALTVVAGFAILFTGRYPRSIFDFNVGVLRWSWRVGFYSFSALGTDRYPPFTIAASPDYPADLDVAYPERLARGLVLVKSWLLAIPHYVAIGIIGGGLMFGGAGWWLGGRPRLLFGGGLIGLLVVVAAVVLLFTARYPRDVFDLVVGLNRWVYRVLAYVLLMTDEYPPFRLDQGPTAPAPPAPTEPVASAPG